jgi:glycosyltransferase involved in cell wall biosynthesis
VSVGTQQPYKNHRRLLEAWKRIQGDIDPKVWLVLVGTKGPRRALRDPDFNDLPDRVFMTGRVDDQQLPAIYAGALGCVQISLYEGFGLPALESMASGTPVIASNAASFPEVIGDAGILVDPLDVERIGQAINRIVQDTDLRDDLRKRGLERSKLFTWETTAQRVWEVLQNAAS